MHTIDQIEKIVVHLRELAVALLQLFVDGCQRLVGRLDFLLRGFELLVDTLQLFIGRLHFLVRRLQLLVACVLLLDDRLEILARRVELVPEARDF